MRGQQIYTIMETGIFMCWGIFLALHTMLEVNPGKRLFFVVSLATVGANSSLLMLVSPLCGF